MVTPAPRSVCEGHADFGGVISTRACRRVQALLNAGRAAAVAAYIERRDEDIAREHFQHIAFAAHELRDPLTTAFTAASALKKNVRAEDEHAVGMLVRNLTHLRELIEQVLLADRLSAVRNMPARWRLLSRI